MVKIIGVTGGIASGKSLVIEILKELGVKTIDCDEIAKDVMMRGNSAYDEIIEKFGKQITLADGQIDRKKMASIVFENKDKLLDLNEATHKYVYGKLKELIQEFKQKDKCQIASGNIGETISVLAIEASVPDERFTKITDEIWTVVSDTKSRINRILCRDKLGYDKAIKRIEAQKTDEEYIKMANFVVFNDGNKEQLKKRVISLYNSFERSINRINKGD